MQGGVCHAGSGQQRQDDAKESPDGTEAGDRRTRGWRRSPVCCWTVLVCAVQNSRLAKESSMLLDSSSVCSAELEAGEGVQYAAGQF